MSKEEQQIIFGRHPVMDALDAGEPFEKIWVQQGVRGQFEKDLRGLCRKRRIPLQQLPKEKLNRVTGGGNHQGVVGFVSPIRYYRLSELIPHTFEQGLNPLFVLLDGITDVGNMGAIARSADCAGVSGLVIPRKGTARVNAEAIKSSAGALLRLPVCREQSLPAAVELLKQSGIKVAALDGNGEQAVFESDFRQPLALLMGS
ncbi:MAG: RNA methyltransferase, partial [Saprospiraceae bacterium]|nr:RNA methyltransferase [Saprospiraceae bacterium]